MLGSHHLSFIRRFCNFTNVPAWRFPFGVVHNPMLIRKDALDATAARLLKFKGAFDAAIFGIVGIVENCGVDPDPYHNASEAERNKKFIAITTHEAYIDRLVRLAGFVFGCETLVIPGWKNNLKISLDGR
jgi:hypothetical protein